MLCSPCTVVGELDVALKRQIVRGCHQCAAYAGPLPDGDISYARCIARLATIPRYALH